MVLRVACPQIHAGFARTLPGVLKDKAFVIKGVQAAGDETRRLVRVDYTFSQILNKRKVTHAGWMTLDPDQYWLIVDCENTREVEGYHGRYRYQYELAAGPKGFPLAKKVLLSHQGTDNKGTKYASNVVAELDLTIAEDVPEREFRMSAFGLPEPKGMEINNGGGLSLYLWLFGLTIGCFVSALLIRRLARRRVASTEPQ